MKKTLGILTVTLLFVGCVPQPKPIIGMGTGIGVPVQANSAYGMKPRNFRMAIKNYLSSKLPRGADGQYQYGLPKRAYKRKGFAYGGDIAWKGWFVESLVSIPSRSGRYSDPKPYMVLFSGEQIVEHILGNSHKLLTKVDK